MKGNNWVTADDGKMNSKEFFKLLIEKFPFLRDKINEEDPDQIHMRMETFADYTIEQIKSNNIIELNKCFDFQETKIDLADSGLLNAMTVSYCESLLLGEIRDKMNQIMNMMGPKLKKLYSDYELYYNDLSKNQK